MKRITVTRPELLRDFEVRLRAFHKRGLVAKTRVAKWADALCSGEYEQHVQTMMAVGFPTAERPEDGKLLRSSLGVLCETSTLCVFVRKPLSNVFLIQDAQLVDGLTTSAHVHIPYDYEKSSYFPAASVRAWLIASNRLDEYASDINLQKTVMGILKALMIAETVGGSGHAEIAASLRRATAPFAL